MPRQVDIRSAAGERSVDTSFTVGGHRYHVFAFPTPGRRRPGVRWNLYEVESECSGRMRGVTFGLASSVDEALEAVARAAERHAETGETGQERRALTFRPSPSD